MLLRSCTMATAQSDFSRVTEFHFVILRHFLGGAGYQAGIQGASDYRRGFIKIHAWNTPTSIPPKGSFAVGGFRGSVMVGEDVLRGSLTTGGVSKQMSPKGAICGILGTICTKKTKTKKPLKNLF